MKIACLAADFRSQSGHKTTKEIMNRAIGLPYNQYSNKMSNARKKKVDLFVGFISLTDIYKFIWMTA